MERNVDNRLAHLSDQDIQDLIRRYYCNENIRLLLNKYRIETHPNQLVTLFAPKKTSKVCPYCHENFVLIYKSRSYFSQNDDFCQLCNHREGRCNCINCKEAQEKQQEKEWEAMDRTIDFVFWGSKTDSLYFSQLNIEDKVDSEVSTSNGRFKLPGIINKFPKSGIEQLDRHFQGFMPSNLYIIGGRPSTGKTTIGLWICYYLKFKENVNVVIFSMEMKRDQVLARLGFSHLCTSNSIVNSHFSNETINENLKNISNSFFIHSSPLLNTNDLHQLVSNHNKQKQIDFIFIDDIHRLRLSIEDRKYAANREQEVSKIMRDLKSLALKLDIPILAISQINRDPEYRRGHFPIVQDLKDSGTIENDADFIILLNRPEIYGITEDENGDSLRGMVEFNIAKNRFGRTSENENNGIGKNAFAFQFNCLPDEQFILGQSKGVSEPMKYKSKMNDDNAAIDFKPE